SPACGSRCATSSGSSASGHWSSPCCASDWDWPMITAPSTRPAREARRARHVSLGKRLEVLQLIRAGRITHSAAASLMDVSIEEVRRWQTVHSTEDIVTVRPNGSHVTHEETQLLERRRRLVRLLRIVDTSLRALHGQWVARSRSVPG